MNVTVKYPILEFDENRIAFLEPNPNEVDFILPKKCIALFFKDVVQELSNLKNVKKIGTVEWETGNCDYYSFTMDSGEEICFYHTWGGAAISAAVLDLTISLGVKKILFLGGAGVLIKKEEGEIIIPTSGVRDEGTSYHYCRPSRYITPTSNFQNEICRYLKEKSIPFITGRTWTTDGFYRETIGKIIRRKKENCITVEMEFSALCSVANFRNIDFAQIFYSGDKVDADGKYSERDWQSDKLTRFKLFELALKVI